MEIDEDMFVLHTEESISGVVSQQQNEEQQMHVADNWRSNRVQRQPQDSPCKFIGSPSASAVMETEDAPTIAEMEPETRQSTSVERPTP